MLIHSIVPYSRIFPYEPSPEAKPRFQNIAGGYVELVSIAGKDYVSRVFSTDPAVYLKSELSPGSAYPPENSSPPSDV